MHVIYPRIAGQVVEHDDGSWSPEQFTYVEFPNDPALPCYAIECQHTGPGLLPRITAVHVIQRSGGREVRSDDLRHLKLEDAIEAAWVHSARRPAKVQATGSTPEDVLGSETQLPSMKRTVRGLRRSARSKITPALLDQVAGTYRAARATGAPTKAVADRFGKAPATASLYVKLAREAGLDMGDAQEER